MQEFRKNISRDTNLAVEKELTKSNHLFGFTERNRRLFCFMLDRRRTSPDPESGQAI